MTNLQEVTGVNFEIALEKFQQDLEDVTRNQKTEVSLNCFGTFLNSCSEAVFIYFNFAGFV